MRLVLGLATTAIALMAVPDGVLRVTGANEAWEFALLRFGGGVLLVTAAVVAVIVRRGLPTLGKRGARTRVAIACGLGAAYILFLSGLWLILAFSALFHLMLYLAMDPLDDTAARAWQKAGLAQAKGRGDGTATIARPGA